jgi:hypothetical protein
MSVSLIYQLGVSSVDAVTLYPDFNFEFGKKKIQTNHKTKSGRAWNYLWSQYSRFDIPVEFIHGDNASIINSWWYSNTKLLLFKTYDTSSPAIGEQYIELIGGGFLELIGGGYLETIEGVTPATHTYSTEVFSVYIMNKEQPFSVYQKPYDHYLKGSILLETY